VIALDVTQRGDWYVLSIVGELDVTSSPQVRNEVVRLLTDGATDVVLDLSAVPFVDSFGLGVLVSALKRTRSNGGNLALVVTEPNVQRLLTLTGLDEVFEVAGSVDEVVGG
jgi:anti-sigma B factor antagonist